MIKVSSPKILNNVIGKEVTLRKINSYVSNGTYYACFLDNNMIGMCSPDTIFRSDEIKGNIVSSEVIYGNTRLFLEVK